MSAPQSDAPASSASSGSSGKGRAPHRRNEQARLAVLHAADDLLAERGFAGLTIEGIAARAGVAKQTIYRWWPSKVDVLLDTLIDDSQENLAVPDTGSAREDTRRYLRDLARFITGNPAGKVLLVLIGEAQHDAEMARIFHTRYLDPRREAERAMLARGVASGELADGLDLDHALDRLLGPLFYRALLTGGPIAPAVTDQLVEDVLGGAAARRR
jgi:AcrR family transcriptional regulator